MSPSSGKRIPWFVIGALSLVTLSSALLLSQAYELGADVARAAGASPLPGDSQASVSSVPELGILILLGTGLLALVAGARRLLRNRQ
jgi:hypothetical protein